MVEYMPLWVCLFSALLVSGLVYCLWWLLAPKKQASIDVERVLLDGNPVPFELNPKTGSVHLLSETPKEGETITIAYTYSKQ